MWVVSSIWGRLAAGVGRVRLGWVEWFFLGLLVVAGGMRLWGLEGRVMHYDEAIHLHFAWKLAQGVGFAHSPWMHGPLQIELVAGAIRFVGDTDYVARLPYALFGAALVGLPYFLRAQIGERGAVGAGVILAFSPTLLYFSRFGRNDILMAVWGVLLLILMWRYVVSSRSRYLYWSALVVALMLATKETAYFIILFLGVAALVLGFGQIKAILRRPRRLPELNGAAGFLVFLAALTLPQAAAAVSVLQGPLGLTLAAPDAGSTGETGAPVWGEPFVTLPVAVLPVWAGLLAAAGLTAAIVLAAWWGWNRRAGVSGLLLPASVAVAVGAAILAVVLAVLRPIPGLDVPLPVNGAAMLGLLVVVVLLLRLEGLSVRRVALLLGPPMLLAGVGLWLFSADAPLSESVLPGAVSAAADLEAGRIAVNYLVPIMTLAGLLVVGAVLGTAWGGGVWLAAAAIFYAVWTALYTTLYSNAAGLFTGSWQSLGYWMAQHGEARGNQPWYYYGVGLTVYELLALVFGLIAVIWLIRRRERFGLLLAGWVIATLLVYTIAGEKMPWLLVNITVPLALAAGMFLGHLSDSVFARTDAERSWNRRSGWLAVLAPLWVVGAVWVAWLATGATGANIAAWLAGLLLLPGAALIAWMLRGQRRAGAAAALGLAGLLLAFGIVAAVRAAYTYDDSSIEILAYAQGSADLAETYRELGQSVTADADGDASGGPAVKVDYDMWYPFQWYVRNETEAGALQFDTFCAGDNQDGSDACRRVGDDPAPLVYLAESAHPLSDDGAETYAKSGPRRNLLWYPETYRRPGESREKTAFWQQLSSDVNFFTQTAANPGKLRQALGYIVARQQDSDWYKAEYYQYNRK